jgi:hypothetical protein
MEEGDCLSEFGDVNWWVSEIKDYYTQSTNLGFSNNQLSTGMSFNQEFRIQ